MNDLARTVIDSEYNNVGDLMGIDENLMGAINENWDGMSVSEKMAFLKKMNSKSAASRGSRAEFEKFFKEVPDTVKQQLLDGNLRLADFTVYSIKQVNSKTIKLFEPQDERQVGIRNIANGKLPKNFVFLVSGIYLMAGVAEDAADIEKVKATDFKSVSQYPAIANAEFSLRANKKQIIPEGNIVRRFITDNNHLTPLGYFKLDNPRLIKDDELIEFVVELGTMQGLDPKTFLYVGLDGTGTTP